WKRQSPRPMVIKQREAGPARRGDRPSTRSESDRLSPCVGQPGRHAYQQFLSKLRSGAGTVGLVRALGDAWREASLYLRIWRPVYLGLDHVQGLVQRATGIWKCQGPLGILSRRVECAVLRGSGLPRQRNGETKPAVGG